jgi:hypothetical protein
MITGKIILYEEPKKYQYTNTYWNHYDMYGDSGYNRNLLTAEQQEAAILNALNEATKAGFVLGARVKRKSDFGAPGTIIHIQRTYTMAYNYSTDCLEPLKVMWDKGKWAESSTYDYSADDLILYKEESKNLPVLLQTEKKGETYETLHHFC